MSGDDYPPPPDVDSDREVPADDFWGDVCFHPGAIDLGPAPPKDTPGNGGGQDQRGNDQQTSEQDPQQRQSQDQQREKEEKEQREKEKQREREDKEAEQQQSRPFAGVNLEDRENEPPRIQDRIDGAPYDPDWREKNQQALDALTADPISATVFGLTGDAILAKMLSGLAEGFAGVRSGDNGTPGADYIPKR